MGGFYINGTTTLESGEFDRLSYEVICSCFHYFNLLQHMPQFYEQAPEMQEVSMDSFIKEKMQLKKEKENEALHCMYVVYYKLKGLADWHI